MPVVLRVLCMADGVSIGPMEGWYVHYVDVQEAPISDGWIQLTPDIDDAWVWDSAGDAFTTWNEILKSDPVRVDGKPNRPMTAFTIEVVTLPLGANRRGIK